MIKTDENLNKLKYKNIVKEKHYMLLFKTQNTLLIII